MGSVRARPRGLVQGAVVEVGGRAGEPRLGLVLAAERRLVLAATAIAPAAAPSAPAAPALAVGCLAGRPAVAGGLVQVLGAVLLAIAGRSSELVFPVGGNGLAIAHVAIVHGGSTLAALAATAAAAPPPAPPSSLICLGPALMLGASNFLALARLA